MGETVRWRFEVRNPRARPVRVGAASDCGCGTFQAPDPFLAGRSARVFEQRFPVASGGQGATLEVRLSDWDSGDPLLAEVWSATWYGRGSLALEATPVPARDAGEWPRLHLALVADQDRPMEGIQLEGLDSGYEIHAKVERPGVWECVVTLRPAGIGEFLPPEEPVPWPPVVVRMNGVPVARWPGVWPEHGAECAGQPRATKTASGRRWEFQLPWPEPAPPPAGLAWAGDLVLAPLFARVQGGVLHCSFVEAAPGAAVTRRGLLLLATGQGGRKSTLVRMASLGGEPPGPPADTPGTAPGPRPGG